MAEVREVFDLMENEFGLDEAVDELISTSFVENMPYPKEPGAHIVRLLGPKLTAVLHRQRRGEPSA
jgi:hypothetical protein